MEMHDGTAVRRRCDDEDGRRWPGNEKGESVASLAVCFVKSATLDARAPCARAGRVILVIGIRMAPARPLSIKSGDFCLMWLMRAVSAYFIYI